RLHSPRFAGACCGAFPGGLLAWWVAPPGRGCIAAACTASINNTGAGEARLIPAQLPAPTTTTSAGDGPGRWRAGPSAAAPAKVRGGGAGGRRPGFGDMDVAEKPPWTGSRPPGPGPPTPPPPRLHPANAHRPTRHPHRDARPQRRHHTATPQTPANGQEIQRRHPPSQQAARNRATTSAGEPQERQDRSPQTEKDPRESAFIRVKKIKKVKKEG